MEKSHNLNQPMQRHKEDEAVKRSAAAAHTAKETIKETVQHGKEKLSEMVHEYGAQARQTATRAAHELGDKARQVAHEVAEDVKHGLFRRYWNGLMQESKGTKAFVAIVTAVNVLGGLLYSDKFEAKLVLGAFALSLVLLGVIFSLSGGYTRLLGLSHAPWLPMLWYLVGRVRHFDQFLAAPATAHNQLKAADMWAYSWWLKTLIAVNAVSLLSDAWQAYLYWGKGMKGVRFAGARSVSPGGPVTSEKRE